MTAIRIIDEFTGDITKDILLETITVENTTVETTVWTAGMAANSLSEGVAFKIHADGLINNGGPAAADEITLRIKVSGNTIVTLSPSTKTLTDEHWHLDANATQRTIGATGQRAIHLDLSIGDADTVNVTGVATVNTTLSMDVTITVEWASEDVANIFKLYQAFTSYKNILSQL